MKRILFVCTGNTCRSPMAESMLRRMAEERGLGGIDIRSAGVAAIDGLPISENAAEVLKRKQCLVPDGSKALTASLMEWADVVLTMTSGHKRQAIQRFPESIDKVYTLKEYVNDDEASAEKLAALESLVSELHLKQATAQPVTDEEKRRLLALERELPNPDIADPFGCSLEEYRKCAGEIEQCLEKLLNKLNGESR